jgi:cytochrome c oxidase cbb3-type subunit 4
MDVGTLRGLATLIAMIAFVAVVWWAYSHRQKGRFEEAARLPLEEDHRDEGK